MVQQTHRLIIAAVVVLSFGAMLQAASVDKAIADAESRRKGAENSLREIMAKADVQLDQARASYASAASSQNAWLDLICQGTEPAVDAPDVAVASQAAASALMEWVTIGGRALGLPALSESLASGLEKSITQDLIAIGKATRQSYSTADEKKRTQAITSLRTRLRWKTAEELG